MQDRELKTAVIVSSPWHLRKASSYAFRLEIDHAVEKSKFPHEYLIIGVGIIYFYLYTQMFINLLRYHKCKVIFKDFEKITNDTENRDERLNAYICLIFLKGNFHKEEQKSQKLEFSITEDSKKIWALTPDNW